MTNFGHPKSNKSVYQHILRGTAWAVLMRWSLRGVGLVSTIILARLLVPEDFGVVAMGALIIGFLEGFSELGVQMHLIRKPQASREDCNTAWTLGLIQHVLVALLLVLLSGVAADYFSEPRLTEVIIWVAASAIVTGFTNIGMTALVRKELDFARDFRFNLYRRMLSFFSVVGFAFWLRDYWALVYGQMLFAVYGLVLSYIMHPYRPRWNLSKAREFLAFSLAIIPINFAKYWRDRADILVVGKIGSAAALGVYSVASEMAALISQEIAKPVGRALLPSYAKLAGDHKELSKAFLHVLNAICIVSIPLGLGLSVLAYDFVVIIFGPKWVDAAPFLQWLSIFGIVRLFSTTLSENILIVSGHEKRSAVAISADGIVLLISVVIAGQIWGISAIPIAATVSALMMLPITAFILIRSLPINWIDLSRTIWPASVSGFLMVIGILYLQSFLETNRIFVTLLSIFTGATMYAACIVSLWHLRGRPSGLEKEVISFLWQYFMKKSIEKK